MQIRLGIVSADEQFMLNKLSIALVHMTALCTTATILAEPQHGENVATKPQPPLAAQKVSTQVTSKTETTSRDRPENIVDVQRAPLSNVQRLPNDETGPRSPATARALSIGGSLLAPAAFAYMRMNERGEPVSSTGLPIAASVGYLFGPALGYWYAGESNWQGISLRAAGAATTIIGVRLLMQTDEGVAPIPVGLIWTGVGIGAVSTFYDLIRVGSAARRYNRKHNKLTIAPTAVGSNGQGLMISGQW